MKNKIWFIIGISSGLGKSLADALIENGDFVIGTFRKESQVAEFNAQNHGKAFAYQLDVTDSQAIKTVVVNISATYGKVDVLVNNAGYGFAGAIEEASDSEVRAVFEANFFGSLHVTQAVLPLMRKQKSGHIVQISSHGGIKAFAGFGIYNASKFALEGFSEALEQEVAPLGIKLTIVEPGPFRTGFANASFIESENKIEDYQSTSGAFKERMKAVDGKQEGDPAKAAKAIIQITNMDNPPLRLPLGKIPLTTIQMKIDSVQKDLNDWQNVAESAVFE
jgi:NAD(P)-dependent dehydrogenase (short-subunit alcohol dehydrogenase family)